MTAQIHEAIIYEGKRLFMAFCPPLPENDPRIVEVGKAELIGQPLFSSTACWRGYLGIWEVLEGRLYLNKLIGKYRLESPVPIPADWFSGVLRIPRGEVLHYVHMGFGTVYEEELHVKIDKGSVVDTRLIDNRSKEFDLEELTRNNFPGHENRFPGDDLL